MKTKSRQELKKPKTREEKKMQTKKTAQWKWAGIKSSH